MKYQKNAVKGRIKLYFSAIFFLLLFFAVIFLLCPLSLGNWMDFQPDFELQCVVHTDSGFTELHGEEKAQLLAHLQHSRMQFRGWTDEPIESGWLYVFQTDPMDMNKRIGAVWTIYPVENKMICIGQHRFQLVGEVGAELHEELTNLLH